jgi:hypothetical protein
MKYTIENLFPSPIYVTTLADIDKVQEEIGNAIKNTSYDGNLPYWGKSFDITSLSNDIIKEQNMNMFDYVFNIHLKNYCKEIGFQFREYTRTSWLARTEKNGHTPVHDHAWSDISGVYYYQTNSQDGSIYFIPPTPAYTSLCFQKFAGRWEHPPAIGKLLLFPSYLLHAVQTNESNDERISLSFSVNFKR